MSLLKISYFTKKKTHPTLGYPVLECGTDEAGAGALMGPVVAAAVVWPLEIDEEYANLPEYALLKDSKKLSPSQRERVRTFIKTVALDYHVSFVGCKRIDEINILNSRFEAMKASLEGLTIYPEYLLVDGDKFPKNYVDVEHTTIINGDNKYQSIAAASILAKCARDELIIKLHETYPNYSWNTNKGYGTAAHYDAIEEYGITPLHRKSFNLLKKKTRTRCLIKDDE